MYQAELEGAELKQRECLLLFSELERLYYVEFSRLDETTRSAGTPVDEFMDDYVFEQLSKNGLDLAHLSNYFNHLFHGETLNIRFDELQVDPNRDSIDPREAASTLLPIVRKFTESLPDDDVESNMEKVLKKVKKQKSDVWEDFFERNLDDIESGIVGFPLRGPLNRFKETVKKKLESKNLKLRDIVLRNILMKTDSSGNVELNEAGEPEFYLIDFETKSR